jgi:hypothetical protein
VNRKKTTQRGPSDRLPAEDEPRNGLSHDRRSPCLLGSDDDGPRRILVPAKQLTVRGRSTTTSGALSSVR